MQQCLTLMDDAARSAGFEGEIAELYRQVCDELERQLQHPGDPGRERRPQLARDLSRRLATGEP